MWREDARRKKMVIMKKEQGGEQDRSEGVGNLCVPSPSQEELERIRPWRARFMIKSETGFYRWLDWLDKMVLGDQTADKGGWVFRGQADATWGVKSSFERTITEALIGHGRNVTEEDLQSIERMLIAKFRSRCVEDFNIRQEDVMGWMCAMQHYGAPTRLIDFSVSPLVALYMATKGRNPSAHFSVWAVYRSNYQTVYNSRIPWLLSENECDDELFTCKDIEEMSARSRNTRSNIEKGFRSNWKYANAYLSKGSCPDGVINMNLPKVLWIVPEVVNSRLLNQGGLFLMPMSLRKTAMQQLFWKWPNWDGGQSAAEQFIKNKYTLMSKFGVASKTTHLIQFVFSKKLSEFASRFLTRANIRGSLLFPDIHGVAEELNDAVRGDTLRFK